MLAIWLMYLTSRERNFKLHRTIDGAPVVFIRNKRVQKRLRDEGTLAFVMFNTVFIRSRYVYAPALLRHELTHVKQYRREGWPFIVKYLYHDLFTGYKHNPYEIEARAAE